MKNLKQVSPEDFDVETLLAAAREGRLFVDEGQGIVSKEVVKQEVRAYVARIYELVVPCYKASVDALWEDIFCSDELMGLLMPKPKARKCRAFDKYGVMRLIGVLREKGVYQPLSDYKFHVLLEQTDKDSSFRSYLSQGLSRSQMVEIRKIIDICIV